MSSTCSVSTNRFPKPNLLVLKKLEIKVVIGSGSAYFLRYQMFWKLLQALVSHFLHLGVFEVNLKTKSFMFLMLSYIIAAKRQAKQASPSDI